VVTTARLGYLRMRGKMHAHTPRTALVSVLVLAGASVVASFLACATGGTGAQSGGSDASTGSGSGGQADSSSSSGSGSGSSSGSSSGGGCTANTMIDPANCGSCGHVCPTGDICTASQCQAPCAAPTSSCATQAGCFNLTNDSQNCGMCGLQCLPPAGGTVVGTAMCVNSQCQFTCPTDAGVVEGGGPIVQCEADAGTPGCYDLTSSSEQCGSCGTACTGSQICTQSHCCATGDKYCGGTCTDVTTSATNCGACDAGCPSPATCSAGVCTGYTLTTPTIAFVNACAQTGATTVLRNDGIWSHTNLIGLPFPFTFYGVSETQFWLQNEGTIGFGAPGSFPPPDGYPDCTAGGSDPTTGYPAAVVFGDENLATGPNGVCYATLGTAPNQQFVATWDQATDATDTGSTLTFSVVVTQTTNTIDFMYQTATTADGGVDTTVSGITATVGIQGLPGGTFAATPYSCAAGFLKTTPLVVRFTPVQ
jgi:hypothetical protein